MNRPYVTLFIPYVPDNSDDDIIFPHLYVPDANGEPLPYTLLYDFDNNDVELLFPLLYVPDNTDGNISYSGLYDQ